MASRKRSISNDADVSALYKEWDEASCAICMDHPHNAVLLICSSHDKGCRSYICDTSYRHSNCLDRFKKLKDDPSSSSSLENPQSANLDSEEQEWSKLKCPLCRGSILGCKVLEDARKYLNSKPRSCSRETCSFSGSYGELRAHARRVHPSARPADVDPTRQMAWRHIEDQREYNDIMSALRSAMPGAVVIGDYMIESGDRVLGGERNSRTSGGGGAGEGGQWLSTTLLLFQMIGSLDRAGGGGRSRVLPRHRRASGSFSRRRYLWGENLLDLQENDEEEEEEDGDDDDENEHEQDLNIPSDLGPPNRRRRRRLVRAQSDEDQQ